MNLLLIFLLAALAALKVTLQGQFSRRFTVLQADMIFFNAIVFVFIFLIFTGIAWFSGLVYSAAAILYGSLFGLFSFLFQNIYTAALKSGSVSLTILFTNFGGILLPLFCSILLYHEPATVYTWVGLGLLLGSMLLSTEFRKKAFQKRWFLLSAFCFLANGFCCVVQKVYSHTEPSGTKVGFISVAYGCAALLSLLYYVFRKERKTFTRLGSPVLFALGTGFLLGIFQVLMLYAVGHINGAFLYPVYSGTSSILMTVIGIVLFRDKLTKKQAAGLFLGCAAIIVLNI